MRISAEVASPTDIEAETEFDFVVIGAGAGGLSAAIRATDLGMSTLVLEASDRLGGVTAYSGGHCFVPGNHRMSAEGLADADDDAIEYLRWVSGAQLDVDEDLLRSVVVNARRVFSLLSAAGIGFGIIPVADHFYPEAPGSRAAGRLLEPSPFDRSELGEWAHLLRDNPHFPAERGLSRAESMSTDQLLADGRETRLSLGEALAGALARAALVDRGIRVVLGARARSLTISHDRITGVVYETVDGSRTVTARHGVLVAAGSYGNASYARETEGLPEFYEASPPVLRGDNLTLADSSPAAVVRGGQPFMVLGYRAGGETHAGTDEPLHRQAFAITGRPHAIVVNRDGERFGDESHAAYMSEAAVTFDRQLRCFPNCPSYLIVDDRFRHRIAAESFLGDDSWPEEWLQADDLTDLAKRLEIDPGGLARTVDRFNGDVTTGHDSQFGRGLHPHAAQMNGDRSRIHPNLGTLEHPPFWGIPLVLLGVGIYSMGIWVDAVGRARRSSGEVVDGMYATGNAAAYTEQRRYQGGYANTRNITLGFLAAENAAQNRTNGSSQ